MTEILPRGPRRGDEVELLITGVADNGRGVADWHVLVGPQQDPRKYKVLVRKAYPGDRVRVRIDGRKRKALEAGIVELVTPAPGRVEARCPHFGQREEPGRGCGGCTFQALDYAAQLALKRGLIQKALSAAKIAPDLVAAPIGAANPWRYRGKMELTFADNRARQFALGLYPTGFRKEVIRLEACHLMLEGGEALIRVVREWAEGEGLAHYSPRRDVGFLRSLMIREAHGTGERMVELVTTPDPLPETGSGPQPAEEIAQRFADALLAGADALGVAVTSVYWTRHRAVRGQPTRLEETLLRGTAHMTEALTLPDGQILRFAIHPRAFFQPNPKQAEVLCAEVIGRLSGAHTVLDLYCGTGTLGMSLAPFVQRVVGIELVADAVANARANAAANGLDNVSFFVGDVAAVLDDAFIAQELAGMDAVVVDPPRAGLSPKALEIIVGLAPPKIVYVSCNPKSLGRDLAVLLEGGYTLDGPVQPVDLFPHTPHVENVVSLRLAGGPPATVA